MKVVHWTMYNSSGMNSVAETMSAAERKLGIDSNLANAFNEKREDLIDRFRDADIHFSHTYFPSWFRKAVTKDFKLVWLGHGTPENVFYGSVEEGDERYGVRHGINDGVMLQHYYLQHADLIVTHWPRHQAIYQTMVDRATKVHLVPMGVDLDFWKPVPSEGKPRFLGTPSLLYAENTHNIKWPYDILVAWPWVQAATKLDPILHVTRLPLNLHRWFFPLVNRNGASYSCHISPLLWTGAELRNALSLVDYQIGLVIKGDFNRISLEANACGCKTISYVGNPYSDFWVPEGDQRNIAAYLVEIIEGRIEPRKKTPVPSSLETAKQMKVLYESL